VVEGTVQKGDMIYLMASKKSYEVIEVGVFTPKELKRDYLGPGDVGYLVASIKSVEDVNVGDTITHKNNQTSAPLAGYRKLNPMVFCGIYPIDSNDYDDLRDALEKLRLNDASLIFEPETSQALGFGFRIGFLGLLHMEIIQERINREFHIPLIATSPSVIYHVTKTNGEAIDIDNPVEMPNPNLISSVEEPFVTATIMTPETYVGNTMEICQNKRGIFKNMSYIDETRVELIYEMPLLEIVYDFFDKLKSSTKGYASFDYEFKEYKKSNLVKMDILINGKVVDALSTIVYKEFAFRRGKAITEKLKEVIPRHMFEVPIQAAIQGRVIARSTIKALRKNVIAKCYGGDISRKRKLLEKQKEGKKKMKNIGNVDIPQEAFLSVLSLDE
jgi:GTP-binding protein LepA